MSRLRFLLACSLALLLAAAPRSAVAAPDAQTRAVAERLFDEGLALMAAGDTAAACAKMEKAVELTERQAAGGLMELGRCWQKLGRSASAWAMFREAAARAATLGQADREREATEAAAALNGKLAYVRVRITAPLEGLRIFRDGVEVPRATHEEPLPVDPGRHHLEVTAPGRTPWARDIDIKAEPGQLDIDVPALAPLPVQTALPRTGRGAPPFNQTVSVWSPARLAGIGVGGAGVVALGASLGLVLGAKSDYDAALASCTTAALPLCPPESKQAIDAARGRGDIATGLLVGGAAFAAAGVVMVIVAPSKSMSAQAGTGSVALQLGPGALRLQGTW